MNWFNIKKKHDLPERSIDEIKNICKILFIDDKKYPVVDILQTSGWKNAKRIKDVRSLDDLEVTEANIIFVDVQGVGRTLKFKDEGLGLTKALKEKYPNKKVIVYSSEDESKNDTFHNQWQSYRTKKDRSLELITDPYQYSKNGDFRVMVKVIDIFGNDTTHIIELQVR
jgi:hypothetical protein